MKNNLVVQSNVLVEASYSMTLNEQKVLMACISQIDSRSKIEEGKEFVLPIQQAQDLFQDDRDTAFKKLKRSSEQLFRREVRIQIDENRELLTHFVRSVLFDKEQAEIRIIFSEDIKPYLSQLEQHFTSYKLKNIVQLKSAYAVRLYQFICEWHGQGKDMEIMAWEKLNTILGSNYKTFDNFRRRILDVAVEQINIYTDFQVAYALQKTGRRISHIQFQWELKNKPANIEQRKIENQVAKTRRLQAELQQAQKELTDKAMSALESLPRGTQFLDEKDCIYTIEATNPLLIYTTDKDGHKFYVSNTEKFAREWYLDGKLQLHFTD